MIARIEPRLAFGAAVDLTAQLKRDVLVLRQLPRNARRRNLRRVLFSTLGYRNFFLEKAGVAA